MDKELTIDWKHIDLKTGEETHKGTFHCKRNNMSKVIGPGVTGEVISRLRKNEEVSVEIESLNLKAIYTPRKKEA